MFSRNHLFTLFLFSCLLGIGLWNTTEDLLLSSIIIGFILNVLVFLSYHYRQIIICLFFITWGAFLWITSSIYYQDHQQSNMLIVDRYQWLYNSYLWEVKSVHKRWEFQDEYILELRQINSNIIDNKILNILRIPKNFSLKPGQYISYQWKVYLFEDFNGFSYQKYMLSQDIYFSTSSRL